MRTPRGILTLAVPALLLLPAGALSGQTWAAELRAGAAVPVDDLGEAQLESGFGFDVEVSAEVVEALWLYAGWGAHELTADAEPWGADAEIEQTGYRAGLRWMKPFPGEIPGSPAFWALAGVTAEHLEIEDADENPVDDTGHGAGWEAGAGVALRLFGGWTLSPGVRYRALSREVSFGDFDPELYLEYLALDVGLGFTF